MQDILYIKTDRLFIILLKGGNIMDKETLKMFSELLDEKLGALENRLDKEASLLNNLASEVETIAEAQKSHMGQGEKWFNRA